MTSSLLFHHRAREIKREDGETSFCVLYFFFSRKNERAVPSCRQLRRRTFDRPLFPSPTTVAKTKAVPARASPNQRGRVRRANGRRKQRAGESTKAEKSERCSQRRFEAVRGTDENALDNHHHERQRRSSYWEDEEERERVVRNDNNKNPPNPRGVPPRWQNVLKKYVLNPYGVFALVALLSVLNPQYIDKGRSNLAMQLYNRDTPGDIVAYKTKDGNLFKVSKDEGIITYNGKDGMVVDSKGGVWIAVARKDQPEIVKEKYYVGQIEDVPVLPKNPTKGEQKLFDKYMQETFAKTLQDVPKDLKKVYNTKDPEFILPLTEKEIAEDGYYFGDEEDWMARRD